MQFVVGIVSSIATKVAECTLSPIKNYIKCLSNHKNNVKTLKDQAESLKDARERVLHSIDAAKGNGEEIEDDVQKWLSTVDKKILEEVEKVMQDEEKAKKKCFIGLCPNFWTRYQHSMKAEKEAKAVAELLEHGKFERVSYRAAPHCIMATSVRGFEEFESRTMVLNGIMDALNDDAVSIIGVYGMGGIGKTMLVKEVVRQVNEGKLFDSAVIATVTQTLDVEKIQNQIADFLGLKFEEQSMVGKAARLRERLKKEEKILVVLDDVWQELDIEEVGIPFGDEHKGCKILLTSRDLNVLSNGMDTQKSFAVGLLKENESWELFNKMAGDCVESCDLQPTATEVAKRCAGLPIAIATVARALRKKSLSEWKNALRELKRPSSSNFTGITAAYSAIEWSYNYLESEEVKLTFLLCCLIGNNGFIEDLVKYTLGLGLFDGVNTVEESRDKVLTVVANLKASCLLLDSFNNERFDIHDVVRDAALTFASRDRHMLLSGDHVPKEWSDKEKMNNWIVISLCSPQIIAELPEEMESPGLSLFHMAHDGSVEIPPNFFRRTESLKVVDLFGMRIPSLPKSINHLTDLRMLRLKRCTLEDITIIGMLKKLEILSLSRSDIEALPQEIAQLTRLKLLDLSFCTKLKTIPPNVLSSLSKLEEIFMHDSFAQWEGEVAGSKRRNASLDEINNLPHLTTLYAHIPNAQMIPKHLVLEKLHRYWISIGGSEKYRRPEYSRTLRFKLNTSICLDRGVKILWNKSEELYLKGLRGPNNVLADLSNGEDFPHLKKLRVRDGLQVQFITMKKIDLSQLRSMTLEGLPQLISFCAEDNRCSASQQEVDTSSEPLPLFHKQFVFPHLESLHLSFINAKRIWHNQLSETYYCAPNLTSLIIKGCGKLEHLLSPSIARSLLQLQHFEIVGCKCLREIIFSEEIEEERKGEICFPRLNSLYIKDLQNLIKFCSGNFNIEFPSLKVLKIEHCPKLNEFINQTKMEGNNQSDIQALFNEKAAVPRLERMTISNLSNVKMIFHNELLAGSFCKLKEMTVTHCDELLTIFSSTIVEVFNRLETLRVKCCDSVEQIFEFGGLNIKETDVGDSQLRELHINGLPKLKHLWNEDPQGILTFLNLRKVNVWGCRTLKNLFPASVAKDLPQLEDLRIGSCGMEEIVMVGEGLEQPVRFKFPQVSSLELGYLNKLKCFYPGQHTIVWPKLKKLRTDYSTLLKIVASEGLRIQEMDGNGQRESTFRQPLFLVEEVIPKLEELRLQKIDAFATVCNDQFPADIFHQIKVFELDGSQGGSFIFPSLRRFHNLESLEFSHFDFKDVVEKRDAVTFTRIRKLKLESCKNLEQIWKKDLELGHILLNLEALEVHSCNDLINFGPSLSSVQNLTTLEVSICKMMTNLVTPSVVQHLVLLTVMRVNQCFTMKEIVANEACGATTDHPIVFGKLKCLELSCLKSLASFCPGNYIFEFPCLEELIVNQCPRLKIFSQGVLNTPRLHRIKEWRYHNEGHWGGDLNTTIQQLFIEKVGYNGLDRLKFSDAFPELLEIWNKNPQEILDLKNLGHMDFCNCSSLKYIFTSSMALLKRLKSLEVKECGTMEEVIKEQGIEEEPTDKLTFPPLQYIEIVSCSNLTSFYSGSRALEFPSLSRITIADCPKMTAFASSFSRSADASEKGLDQGDITAAFFSDKVVCSELENLDLSSINIQKIWHDPILPSSLYVDRLKFLAVKGCHNLKYLFSSCTVKDFVQLRRLRILDCKIIQEVIFTDEFVAEERMSQMLFPKLKFLWLSELPKLTSFCSENYFEFLRLKGLRLTNCPSLKTFISKSVPGDIEGSSNLEVENSALFNEKMVFPSLKKMTIKDLRQCRKIWQDQLTVNSFRKLNRIWVESCQKLLHVFPFNMMEKLEELHELHIKDCESLEEIIEPQGLISNGSHGVAVTPSIVAETGTRFVFPKVTYLQFENLPRLKNFYSRMHATEWPSLKQMYVIECQEVDIFSSRSPCSGETQTGSQVDISNQQPLFWVSQDTFPLLEEVTLKRNDMKRICHGQLSMECFKKLKVLNLECFRETSTAIPYCFIQSLQNLEKFVIKDSAVRQFFQSEGLSDEERHTAILTQIKELRLSKLPELTHLWEEELQPGVALCNLRILEVLECGKLKILEPSLLSFKNLTTLEVSRCHGFIKLIACSTAKSLVLLERMSITDCELIEEIISCEGEEIQGGIVFTQLKYLHLSCLPSLASFSLGDHMFELPVLQTVLVRECPKMKNFCQGELSTPKLQHVQLIGDESEVKLRWEGDLNTTLKHLFNEMNVQSSELHEVRHQLPKLE